MGRLADPLVRVSVVLAAIALAGAAGLILAWRGAAATLAPWDQVPFMASGAIAGAALLGAALGFLSIHADRYAAAQDQADLEDLVDEAAAFADAVRRRFHA